MQMYLSLLPGPSHLLNLEDKTFIPFSATQIITAISGVNAVVFSVNSSEFLAFLCLMLSLIKLITWIVEEVVAETDPG